MCGIAGYLRINDRVAPEMMPLVDSMLGAIVHRGPDDAGLWLAQNHRVCLGHRRLSVLDLTPAGHQPMVLSERALAITYNGEIYNYRELRSTLEEGGANFRSHSDTEVLLHAYARWGSAMLDRLVGMFAFAIWDGTKEELFLARDRAGEKPLYHASTRDSFVFASELQAVTRVPGIDDTVDREALALYLEYQYVPSPKSIYRGVKKLPPAHAMIVDARGTSRIWRYWDPTRYLHEPPLDIDENAAADELERLLRQSISGQMLADVPVGAFLSGGIDSSVVVSMMAELSRVKVKTFTIGFDDEAFDESKHSERVAHHIGTDHTVELLTENDAIDLVPRLPAMYGEPFADASALPTQLVSSVARKQVTVSLSGDGGDEAFGGYNRYVPLISAHRPLPAGPLRPFLPWLPGRIGRVVRRLALTPQERFRNTLTMMPGEDAARLAGVRGDLLEFDRAWNQQIRGGSYRKAMLADMLAYLPEAILVKVDRAAMSVSLETRAPLLDHRILEFSLRLPVQLLHQKRLLKTLAYRRIPRALLDRPKQGFGVPVGRWFRGRLRELLLDGLSPRALANAGIVDLGLVADYVREHLKEGTNHEARLWTLLMFSLWHQGRKRQPVVSAGPVLSASTS